jgi:hypothetical protein
MGANEIRDLAGGRRSVADGSSTTPSGQPADHYDVARDTIALFQATGARILRSAVQAPRMNATCERLVGTLRREILDRVLILSERHLRSVLAEYQAHYNTARPRQGIAQRVPDDEGDAPRVTANRPRHRADPPKTRPGRPDQRIHARRLTPRRSAGHQPNPIFERDRMPHRKGFISTVQTRSHRPVR